MRVITYDPSPGTHIRNAATKARCMATKNRRPVRFKFNDVVLTATRKTSVDSLLWTFGLVMSQHAQQYRNSRRGREAEARRKQQIIDAQHRVDHLLNTLDASIQNGLDDTVLWLSRFSEVSDDCGVRYSTFDVSQKFVDAGYSENQHVGRPQEDFHDRQTMGEYIVGQAISCLRNGMPPHPITTKFADQYFKS